VFSFNNGLIVKRSRGYLRYISGKDDIADVAVPHIYHPPEAVAAVGDEIPDPNDGGRRFKLRNAHIRICTGYGVA